MARHAVHRDAIVYPSRAVSESEFSNPGRSERAFPFGWPTALGLAGFFILAMLPSLHRLEFFDGVEHFTLATVQEMKRDGGNWLLPTLQGEPRVVKPPLTAWLTSALVSPANVAELSSRDASVRAAAFDRFVFFARLPTIFCAALMLLGVFQLASVVTDRRTGIAAMLICAGLLLFLYQSRRATTDLQLAVWVTWTNALLATAIVQQRLRFGILGAGVALGLAMLAKGPHIALLLTVVPAIVYLMLAKFTGRPASAGRLHRNSNDPLKRDDRSIPSTNERSRSELALLCLASSLIAIVIGFIWYAYVLWKVPGVWSQWVNEILRKDIQVGRNTMRPDPWYAYVTVFSLLMPWTPWVLCGAWQAIRTRTRLLLPAIALLLPLIVMSFFGEKKVRYLLPFAGSAAVLAAAAFTGGMKGGRSASRQSLGGSNVASATIPPLPDRNSWHGRLARVFGFSKKDTGEPTVPWKSIQNIPLRKILEAITLISAIWMSIGLPIVGAIGLKGYRAWDGAPWFSPALAATAAGVGAMILVAGFVLARRSPLFWLLAIVLVAGIGSEMRLRGDTLVQGDSDDRPQRQLAEKIWRTYPAAKILSADSPTLYGQLNRGAIVLSMFTDRTIYTAPETLPTKSTGQPLILITDSIRAVPPVPPGWKRWAETPLRVGWRYVDVLE